MLYAIVTGGAGGIGSATVKKLSDNGYYVFSLDINEGIEKENIKNIICDITDIESINKAFDIIRGITDRIDAILHFGGIYYLDSLVEIEEDRFEKIFKINVFGPYLINKTFLPLLQKNSRIIIATSELAGLSPLPFTGLYAVTKGALDKYSYSLRMELQLKDIKVSVIRPGAVKTKLLDDSTSELDKFCNNTKLYDLSASNFKKIVDSVESKNIEPERLAKFTYKVLQKKNPKYCYYINRNKLLILLNILPKRFQFWIIKKILNKKK